MNHCKAFLSIILLSLLPASVCAEEAGERVQIGKDIVVGAGETISEAVCVGCSIHIQGTIAGDAVAVAGDIEVDGTVGGNLVSVAGTVRLGPAATVDGDVVSALGSIDRHPEASVGGEVTEAVGLPFAGLGSLLLFALVCSAIIHLFLVLLTYLIAGPRRVETVASTVRERAGLSLLAGLGVLVGAVVLYIISSLMGPVTPVLAILVSAALFLTLVMGYTGLSYWVGRGVARGSAPLVAVLLGALLITLLQLIPLLGIFACAAFILLALGSAAVSGLGSATNWLPQQFASSPVTPSPPPTH